MAKLARLDRRDKRILANAGVGALVAGVVGGGLTVAAVTASTGRAPSAGRTIATVLLFGAAGSVASTVTTMTGGR